MTFHESAPKSVESAEICLELHEIARKLHEICSRTAEIASAPNVPSHNCGKLRELQELRELQHLPGSAAILIYCKQFSALVYRC